MKDLQIAWQDTTAGWDDAVSQHFCETHLEPIGPALKLALDAVGRMDQLTRRIYHDCEG